MKTLFGTDGIRGEAGKFPLDEATVRIIGSSLASYLKNTSGKTPAIVIGRDTRESGPWLEAALIEGAATAGADCLSAGVITTPGVAYLTRVKDADAGVVISASHNPYHDNGIKIFAPSGRKIADTVERKIEADIFAQAADRGDFKANVSPSANELELRKSYENFLAGEIADGLNLAGLKLVIDCANGASSGIAPALFKRLGADVLAINAAPDGKNINLNCGSLHIESLQKQTVTERSDLGIAFDGDADRSLFVDSKGNFIDGDGALWVLAQQLQDSQQLKENTVVATVMSNIGLEIALRSRGIELIRTDVGDKYVLEELLRRGVSLGGEQSGHIIFPELSLAGDGMITSLCLLRAMVEARKSLADLVGGFEHYPQTLLNVRVREKIPFEQLPTVQEAAKQVEEQLSQNGRLLLRYSGTEPLARVMIEGANQNEIESYAEKIASQIKQEIGA